MSSSGPPKPLKLLSLDGGGVRGLASLLILDNLMRRVNKENPPKPCEVFDLIGGTNTGGLIAVMLGPLEMGVQSCIDAYIELLEQVFIPKKSWSLSKALDLIRMKERFDSAKLTKAIVKIIEHQGRDKDMMIFDEGNPHPKCNVFVCVTLKSNAQNTCFRNYSTLRGTKSNCRIWEACRATSAASSFFNPITIGNIREFVDGATGRNNPVNQVLEEARDIWPGAYQRIQCFISIGTGQPSFKKYGSNLVEVVKTLKNIATETERTAEAFLKAHPDLSRHNRYFRFNVTKGLENIGLNESKKIGEMNQATHVYLESEGVRVEMENCIGSLKDSSISGAWRGPVDKTIFKIDEDFTQMYENIRTWLSPPAYDSDYLRIRAQREPNTCRWIFEPVEMVGWNDGSSQFVWIHGKPGCGKSVIALAIVEMVEIENSKSTDSWQKHLGYVFCDKTDASKRDCLAVMKVLVWQIISRGGLQPHQKQIVVAAWKTASNTEALSCNASNSAAQGPAHGLFELFRRLVASYTSCSIILDGLDECEYPENLLRWLLDLLTTLPPVRLLFISQNVSDVSSVVYLSDNNWPTIEITPSDNHNDIALYVDARLPQISVPGTGIHSKIRNLLLKKAQGMFLWVRLAMAQLQTAKKAIQVTESRLLKVVQAFPKKLDDLFIYILERSFRDDEEGLEEDNAIRKRDICRILESVLWSFRPLRIDELQCALEPNADGMAIRLVSEEDSLIDFKAKISSLCAPLLLFHPNDTPNDTVTVVHSTFKVFMDTKVGNYPTFRDLFQPKRIHSRLAAACIQYLQSRVFNDYIWFNKPLNRTLGNRFPFKDYATQYWWMHLGKYPPDGLDSDQAVSEQLLDFLLSNQAITWLENYCGLHSSSTSFQYIYLNLQSNLQQWVDPLLMNEWDIQLLQKSLKVRTIRLGNDDPETHLIMNHLSAIYEFNGQLEKAEELIVQLLATRKSLLGERYPDTDALRSMAKLVTTYIIQRRWDDAEAFLVLLVETRKQLLGEEHLETLDAMAGLAVIYIQQLRWTKAEGLLLQLVETRKRLLGEENLETLNTMVDLATTYIEQLRWREAEDLLIQVVVTRKRLLGEEHLDTLNAMAELATIYTEQFRWEEAEDLLVQVVSTRKRLVVEEHLENLGAMASLATIYTRQHRWVEAGELLVQVVDSRKRLLGAEDPNTLAAMSDLATTYYGQNRVDEADTILVYVVKIRITLREHRSAEEQEVVEYIFGIRKELLGEEHPKTLEVMGCLAAIYNNLDRFAEAAALALPVFDARKQLLGTRHPETLEAMGCLATAYHNLGQFSGAEALELQLFKAKKRSLGAEHLETLRAMANLATTYQAWGRFTKAETLELPLFNARKRLLGAEHLETLQTMANLATTYQAQGQFAKAKELRISLLNIRKRLMGEDHPETLEAMSNLAATYYSLGQFMDAEILELPLFNTRKRLLGSVHPETLEVMGYLTATYYNLGRFSEAAEFGLPLLDARKLLLGTEHLETLQTMENLAIIYQAQGQFSEAVELERPLLSLRRRLQGRGHAETLRTMDNLTAMYYSLGKPTKAKKLLVRTIEMKMRNLGEEHPEVLWAMMNFLIIQGRFTEATGLLVKVVDVREKLLGEEHSETLWAMENLAISYINWGWSVEATKLLVKVVDARKKLLGEQHPETLRTMANLATTYITNQGSFTEATELLIKVVDARKKLLGEEHPETLRFIHILAKSYFGHRWEKAEELLVNLVETRKRLLGEENLDTAKAMDDLATTKFQQDRWGDATELYEKVVDIRTRLLGEESLGTVQAIEDLAATKFRQGEWDEAAELYVKVADSRKKLQGEGCYASLWAMQVLARKYIGHRWEKAEELFIKVLECGKDLLGEGHLYTLNAMGDLAETYRGQSRFKEAEELEAIMKEGKERLLGKEGLNDQQANPDDSWKDDAVEFVTYLADKDTEARVRAGNDGEIPDGEGLGTQSTNPIAPPKTPLEDNNTEPIAHLAKGQTAPPSAHKKFQQPARSSLASSPSGSSYYPSNTAYQALILRHHPPEYHWQSRLNEYFQETRPKTLILYQHPPEYYWQKCLLEYFQETRLQLREARSRKCSESDPSTLQAMLDSATTCINLCQWECAEELLVKVLKAKRCLLGNEHPHTLNVMSNLAVAYRGQNQVELAEELELEAKSAWRKKFPRATSIASSEASLEG